MLVSTADLATQLDDPTWVVFDCRHDLAAPQNGEQQYRAGHIPGAFFAGVDTVLSGEKTGQNGRHPLPPPDEFAGFLARHGVDHETRVVAYDDVGGQFAARLWWMARWIGLRHVLLLDGGWPKWVADSRPVTTEMPAVRAPTKLVARPDPAMIWSAQDVMARLGSPSSCLVDARASERYRGDVEPIDPVAGHIPGAKNRFYKLNLQPDLTFRPRAELHREFAELIGDVAPGLVGHQCGSGITACANIFAMEHAGFPGSKLYAGSWSEWIADRSRPIATRPV